MSQRKLFLKLVLTQSYDLQAALKEANKDAEVRVVVLTGAGKAFCSGQDLKAIAGSKNRSLSDSLYKRYNPIIKAMREMPKPIIGRINGVAAGAGASLALACDFIVAVDTASFIEVFVNVGLVPDSGSSYFLPKAISPARAFEMATMAPKVSAEKALEWGLINRVVSADLLDEEEKNNISSLKNKKEFIIYENFPQKFYLKNCKNKNSIIGENSNEKNTKNNFSNLNFIWSHFSKIGIEITVKNKTYHYY